MKKISLKEAFNMQFDFDSKISKEESVFYWLIEFRKYLLENNIAETGDFIPSKEEISSYLKVSASTVQNALNNACSLGYFYSKQSKGTVISDNSKEKIKPPSKKDRVLVEIKKYLIKHDFKEGEIIPKISSLSNEIKTSSNLIRKALYELIFEGILKKEVHKKETHLILNAKIKLTDKEKAYVSNFKNAGLVSIIKEKIKEFIRENCPIGGRIPSNQEFSKMFKVSVRTVNSAMKELRRDKIISSRRGSYGSIYIQDGQNHEKSLYNKKDVSSYKWESALKSIKSYILKNHEAGDRIPSIKDFAKKFNTSTSTIKRAVKELSSQGILFAQKGKYGGLFVTELPEREGSYQWLIINPSYFE